MGRGFWGLLAVVALGATGCGGGGGAATVSSGSYIVQTGDTTFRRYDRATRTSTPITIVGADRGPIFNSDFTQYIVQKADLRTFELRNIDGSLVRDLPSGSSFDLLSYIVSPNFEYILGRPDGSGSSNGYRIPISGASTTMTGPLAPEALSPDGLRIVSSVFPGGLSISNLDGGSATRISNVGSDEIPAFSPDGGKVAYRRDVDKVRVVNVDGTGEKQLLVENYVVFVGWTSNSQEVLVYLSDTSLFDFATSNGYWKAINVNTGAVRTFLDLRPTNSFIRTPVLP